MESVKVLAKLHLADHGQLIEIPDGGGVVGIKRNPRDNLGEPTQQCILSARVEKPVKRYELGRELPLRIDAREQSQKPRDLTLGRSVAEIRSHEPARIAGRGGSAPKGDEYLRREPRQAHPQPGAG